MAWTEFGVNKMPPPYRAGAEGQMRLGWLGRNGARPSAGHHSGGAAVAGGDAPPTLAIVLFVVNRRRLRGAQACTENPAPHAAESRVSAIVHDEI
jgi:hypothetical protein